MNPVFPNEIILTILLYVPVLDLFVFRRINTNWRRLCGIAIKDRDVTIPTKMVSFDLLIRLKTDGITSVPQELKVFVRTDGAIRFNELVPFISFFVQKQLNTTWERYVIRDHYFNFLGDIPTSILQNQRVSIYFYVILSNDSQTKRMLSFGSGGSVHTFKTQGSSGICVFQSEEDNDHFFIFQNSSIQLKPQNEFFSPRTHAPDPPFSASD
jgi:hypothetical protein